MADEDASKQRLLHITVLVDRVVWELSKCEVEGSRTPLTRSTQAGIALDSDPQELDARVKTITLLADLQQLVADMRRSASWDANVIDGIAYRVVESLGEQLYRFLFPEGLANVLNTSIRDTVDGMLRIELEFQGEALERYGRWPWEYLRSPMEHDVAGSGRFLALCAQLMFNRRLLIDGESAAIRAERPRVLLIVGGPPGKPLGEFGIVAADKVVTSLDALHKNRVIELIKLVEPEFEMSADWQPTASWAAFEAAIKEHKPDVIHFIGHGLRVHDPQKRSEYSKLMFVGPGCRADARRDSEFVSAVANNKNLKLVFLQACESGVPGPHASATSVGQLLAHHGIPAVVAMQAKVENMVANDFAEAFYKALSEHKPIDFAVRQGREAIKNEDDALKLAFGVPVLYLRSYEALIQRPIELKDDTVSRTNVPRLTPPPTSCPRCGSAAVGKACARCGLRMNCRNEACNAPLKIWEDPVERRLNGMMLFCSGCGTKNEQEPWAAAPGMDSLAPPRPPVH